MVVFYGIIRAQTYRKTIGNIIACLYEITQRKNSSSFHKIGIQRKMAKRFQNIKYSYSIFSTLEFLILREKDYVLHRQKMMIFPSSILIIESFILVWFPFSHEFTVCNEIQRFRQPRSTLVK